MKIRFIHGIIPVPVIIRKDLDHTYRGRSYGFWVEIDELYNCEPLIQHELQHCKDLWRWLVIPYIILYHFNESFRIKMEIRAYRHQIDTGIYTPQYVAKTIAEHYTDGRDWLEILAML